MKQLFYIIILLIAIKSTAQTRAVKKADFNGEQVFIKFQDIDHLSLIHNENSKIEISMDNYLENPNALSMEIIDKKIFINSNKLEIFKEPESNKFCAVQPFFASYTLSIPKGAIIFLSYNDGNLIAKNFNADLFIEINKGHLMFEDYHGHLDMKFFSGSVKLSVDGAAIDLYSAKGQILSNLPIEKMEKSKNSLKGVYENSDNSIKVSTIHANIELSPVRSQ